MRAGRGQTEANAKRAAQASTRTPQDQAAAKTAQKPLLLLLVAYGSHTARAIPDGGGMQSIAQRAIKGSTRARRDLAIAKAARLTPIRLLRALKSQTALATRATGGQLEGSARFAR